MTCSIEIGNGRQFGQTELKEKPAKLVQEITSLKFQTVKQLTMGVVHVRVGLRVRVRVRVRVRLRVGLRVEKKIFK